MTLVLLGLREWAALALRAEYYDDRDGFFSGASQLLRDEQFTPVGSDAALFIPPATSRVMLRSAAAWERIGKRWFPTCASNSFAAHSGLCCRRATA